MEATSTPVTLSEYFAEFEEGILGFVSLLEGWRSDSSETAALLVAEKLPKNHFTSLSQQISDRATKCKFC
jgi:hypothetical protein